MTPKEKAKELLKEFLPHAMFYIHDLTPQSRMKQEQRENAIECVRILLKEMISSHNKFDENTQMNTEEYYYWLSVKYELEAL